MARIYVSSAYADLKEYRAAVYRTLRQMGHDVIAMEDYVACDQRPVVKCLSDVANCDLYLGIFAWRYGYVPPADHSNPRGLSITELEYRKAVESAKPSLIFLLKEGAQWPDEFVDRGGGENGSGACIAALRRELAREKTVGFFESVAELGLQVSVAVAQWDRSRREPPTATPGSRARWQEWLAATILVRRNTRRYLRTLVDEHRIFSFLNRANPLELDQLYVSLKVGDYIPRALRPDQVPTPAEWDGGSAGGVGHSVEVAEALVRFKHVVVLGEPGSGKTTLLKYLALQLARRNPALAAFARAQCPTRRSRVLGRLVGVLAGASINVERTSTLLTAAALVVWVVEGLRSPTPITAVAVGLGLTLALVIIASQYGWKRIVFGSALASVLIGYAAWQELVGPLALGVTVLALVLSVYPFWIRPSLELLRWALHRNTRYPLPLVLALNELAQDARPIEAHLADTLIRAGFAHPRRFLARQLAQGRCALLLDALDEVVTPAARKRAVAEVNRLRAVAGAANVIVVTSRIEGLPQGLAGYRQLEVRALGPEQTASFVREWFADAPDAAEQQRRADGLLQALGRNSRMRALAGNPLLLSLMALLYEHDLQLPERRATLYEDCVSLLTSGWESRKAVEPRGRFSSDQMLRVLTALAARCHDAGERVLEQTKLLANLAEVLPACGCAGAEPVLFLDEVMRRTGLLRRKSRASYDFVHLTFQE